MTVFWYSKIEFDLNCSDEKVFAGWKSKIKLKLNISQTCAKNFRFFFSFISCRSWFLQNSKTQHVATLIFDRFLCIHWVYVLYVCNAFETLKVPPSVVKFSILTKPYSILTDIVNHLKRHSIVHNALPTIFCDAPNFYVN